MKNKTAKTMLNLAKILGANPNVKKRIKMIEISFNFPEKSYSIISSLN